MIQFLRELQKSLESCEGLTPEDRVTGVCALMRHYSPKVCEGEIFAKGTPGIGTSIHGQGVRVGCRFGKWVEFDLPQHWDTYLEDTGNESTKPDLLPEVPVYIVHELYCGWKHIKHNQFEGGPIRFLAAKRAPLSVEGRAREFLQGGKPYSL